MEQITPQYKRGKYIRRRKRGKRIAIICLCAAIVLTAAALLYFFRDRIFRTEASDPTDASSATQSSEAASKTETEAETAAAETDASISGTEFLLADGGLLLTYDSDALSLTQDADLTTLLPADTDANTPRMDIQKLPGKLGMLRDSELERIAIGLMQAYYYHPQHTADVELSVLQNTRNEFAATMQVPAIDDAPAAVCSVRLLKVGDELWAAVLLQPEGTETTALTNAFRWLNPTEENG